MTEITFKRGITEIRFRNGHTIDYYIEHSSEGHSSLMQNEYDENKKPTGIGGEVEWKSQREMELITHDYRQKKKRKSP